MSRWRLRTSPQFDKAARRLDRTALRRVKACLEAVCGLDDPRQRGEGLTGDRAGYWRYRVGDWRVIVEIRDRELVIIVVGLGHRSKVYRAAGQPIQNYMRDQVVEFAGRRTKEEAWAAVEDSLATDDSRGASRTDIVADVSSIRR